MFILHWSSICKVTAVGLSGMKTQTVFLPCDIMWVQMKVLHSFCCPRTCRDIITVVSFRCHCWVIAVIWPITVSTGGPNHWVHPATHLQTYFVSSPLEAIILLLQGFPESFKQLHCNCKHTHLYILFTQMCNLLWWKQVSHSVHRWSAYIPLCFMTSATQSRATREHVFSYS